ncbi:hypothetical protein [Chitinimonas sp.]|uniref:hypothetical protein n=1 Tax=Chitinimonas sp. TaxID=1934313 RepID=UPI002F920DBE
MAFWQRRTDAEKLAQWRQLEQRGFVLFLLDVGLLRWGLPMCVLFTAGPVLFGLPMPAQLTPEFVFRNAAIWGSAGLFYGAAMWLVGKATARRLDRPRR